MSKKYRSDAMAAIHETMEALHDVGAIGKQTMRPFDNACLTPIRPLKPKEIKAIREREHVSQTVFANYLNVTSSLVSKWERGEKRPSGASLKLLSLVEKNGACRCCITWKVRKIGPYNRSFTLAARLEFDLGPKAARLFPMRLAAALILVTGSAFAQFKSNVPLVVAPTTVTDSKGHYVDGLTTDDLILYDNNVPQAIQMDWMTYPIDLVVAVETSSNSGAVIDKLGGSGILFTQLLAADAGETAVISFSDDVKVHQEFTGNPDLVIHALRMLRKEGGDARMLDALRQALVMLEQRPVRRRRIILMIAEKRDRSSDAKLAEVMERVERLNAAVYWLTYSPMLEPFTVKAKTAEDLKPEAERIKMRKCPTCPGPDDTPVPADLGPGGAIYAIGELMRLHKPDLASLFTETTGGRTLNFLKKNALEHAIQLVGEEVHRQYILSFQPKGGEAGKFHAIRVAVKNRPELEAKTREGYWALQ